MNPPTFLWPDPKVGPHSFTLVRQPKDRGRPDESSRPWYIRPGVNHPSGKRWHSLGTADTREAIRAARVFLDSWAGQDGRHARAQAALAGPTATTVSRLAEDWFAAGCPDRDERARTPAAAERLRSVLTRALPWWGGLAPSAISRESIRDYARARRAKASRQRGQTGDRVIDLELSALSCLFAWASSTDRAESNPFRDRPRFRRASDVRHCNEFRPATDEELHRILRWLWRPEATDHQVVAGAQLAWCALTGQRPGEASALRVDGEVVGDRRPPGTRWTLRDGSERIAVQRSKGGINPAVRVHPALDAFVRAWQGVRDGKFPASPWWFPHPEDSARPLLDGEGSDTPLNRALGAAVAALGLPDRHPHAMRAFYVRVRRADGADDGTIAVELGQGSGPGLIVTTYGRADDILGDGAFDWLPEDGEPAWSLLTGAAPANVIPMGRIAG